MQYRIGLLCIMIVSLWHLSGCNASGNDRDTSGGEHFGNHDSGWGHTGYGGGGAMFYPAVSPFNPNFAFVACDMTGSFVTHNGGVSWRMFNLRAPVDFFTFDPLDSNTVYAHAAGLYKSSDQGDTWSILYPTVDNIAGAISRGDHASFIIVTKDSSVNDVQAFAVDPQDSKKLYAAIAVNGKTAFYFSSDGGLQWRKEKDIQHKVKSIFILPSSPSAGRTIFITTANGVLKRSQGNWTFQPIPADVKQFTTYSAGYDSATNQFIMYAISGKSYFSPGEDKSGIYFSADGGSHWENRQDGIVAMQTPGNGSPEWRTIATSGFHPATVYVSYSDLRQGDSSCIGVAKSEDFGKTWTLSWKDRLVRGDSKVSDNFNSGWLNERFGPSWGENPFSIGVSPIYPGICYATDFGRTVKTTDGGKSWEQVYTNREKDAWTSRGLEVTTGYNIEMDPFDSAHLVICNTDVGLMESRDGGLGWKSATENRGIPKDWVNSAYWLAFDPEVKGKAWAVMSATHDLPRPKMWRRNGVGGYRGGILTTENGGRTWTVCSAEVGQAAFTHILIDQSSSRVARTLYACAFGKGVYKSTDGGKTWQLKNNGLEGKEPFAWRIAKRDNDGALFLVVSRRSEKSIGTNEDGAVYRSDDGAETWKRMTLPAGTNGPTTIFPDPHHPGRLLLSAWGSISDNAFTPDTGGGIFISTDDGKSWQNVESKDQHIHDITYDERNAVYYACGFESSAYRSEDRGKSWHRIKGYNFKWGKRVQPDPADPDKVFIVTFGGGVWHGPAKGDDMATEDITTPVLSYR